MKICFVQKKDSLKNITICILNFAFILVIFHMTYAFRMCCVRSLHPQLLRLRTLYKVVFYTSAFIKPANHSTQLCMRTLRQTCVYTKLVYTLYRAQSLSCVQTTQTFLICMYKPAGFNLILAGLLHLVCYI